jgi:Isopentenyldiphosphate isomerase
MPAPTESSLIDRVDNADRPVGVVSRGQVFALAVPFRVVHIFVFNRKGELLLQQLGKNRRRNPLRWGSSVAGYLHSGEDYVDAAKRRLAEELNLRTPLMKFGATVMIDQGCRKFITLYTTVATRPRILEPDHIEKVQFWPISKIEQRLSSAPGDFTETFRHVFRFYQSTSAIAE